MKVLFISSGNSLDGISPIIYNQGESLRARGIELDYFTIKGKGISGYLKAVLQIRKKTKENQYSVIHAHYSMSAFSAALSGTRPIVVSLMGSDLAAIRFNKFLIRFFYFFFWEKCIVKSENMKSYLGLKNLVVVPNGVDFERFRPLNRHDCIEKLNWNPGKKHILFAANPDRPEKNYKLAYDAVRLTGKNDIEMHTLINIPNTEMLFHYNAADLVLLTSFREGSPNVIKEAMACNCPIIATDVGDIKQVIGKTEGCYLTAFDPKDLAEKIRVALINNKRTNGRHNIEFLRAENIADRIIAIYQEEIG